MADIQVANAAAQLDGKLLVTAEDDQTVTGQKTFERAPNSPFDVEVGSAVVTNLDADRLDGEQGAFYQDAANLNAGTVPAARLADPLPAKSGENLTNLDATELTGTIPNGSVPNPLPAVSGANLTALPATLPASSGVNLTDLNASELASGTVPDARIPVALRTIERGGNIFNPYGIGAAVDLRVWRAPYACTVTAIRAKRVGGTSCAANAWKNGTSEHLASDITVGTSWTTGGTPQNTAYSLGDELAIRLKSPVGGPTQAIIQVEFSVP